MLEAPAQRKNGDKLERQAVCVFVCVSYFVY